MLSYICVKMGQLIHKLLLLLTSQTGRETPTTPCVNSCCAYRFWGLAVCSDRAAPRREDRWKVFFFSPWCSRRTHREYWHHDREKQPLSTRWTTWRGHSSARPKFLFPMRSFPLCITPWHQRNGIWSPPVTWIQTLMHHMNPVTSLKQNRLRKKQNKTKKQSARINASTLVRASKAAGARGSERKYQCQAGRDEI